MPTREIIAANISALRRAAKLTQAELAEKLNYSDKAVSKWERGDSIPDVLVLAEIAALFSVTVDYFLKEHTEGEKKPTLESSKKRIHLAISLTACISPYIVAIILFFILGEIFVGAPWLWKIFIFPMPAVATLALIFSAVWARSKTALILSISFLLWSVILVAFILSYELTDPWFLFVIGAPLQAVIIFWTLATKKK